MVVIGICVKLNNLLLLYFKINLVLYQNNNNKMIKNELRATLCMMEQPVSEYYMRNLSENRAHQIKGERDPNARKGLSCPKVQVVFLMFDSFAVSLFIYL